MKIAFVYDAVYPWIKGGAEKRIYELGRRMIESGNEVHLYGMKWWDGSNVLEYEGMILHGVCEARELYVNGRRSIWPAMVFAMKLLPELLKERFDVIDVSVFPYFSCFSARIAAFLKGSPVGFTWHEVWGNYWYDYLAAAGVFGKGIERAVAAISPNNIAVSGWTKTRMISIGMNGSRIPVIPNGVDLAQIARIRPSVKRSDIIFVGRLIKEKNVDVLLEAVSLLRNDRPDIRCCIVGDGPEKTELEGLIYKLGITDNVDLRGFAEYDEVIGWMKASRVLVLPSTREGFGMVVVEAFACELPVVTVDAEHNAAQGLIDDACGAVVELDPVRMAAALGRIIADDRVREKMSRNAGSKAEAYDWDEIVGKLRAVYEGIIC